MNMQQIDQSYLVMFNIISTAFFHGCGEMDAGLGPLCGVMDPYGSYFEGPADKAIYMDWERFVQKNNVNKKNILNRTIEFCESIDWGLEHTISFLKNSFTEDMVRKAIEKASWKG